GNTRNGERRSWARRRGRANPGRPIDTDGSGPGNPREWRDRANDRLELTLAVQERTTRDLHLLFPVVWASGCRRQPAGRSFEHGLLVDTAPAPWQACLMSQPGARGVAVLRAAIFVDAVVFLTAALLNGGARLPLGFAELSFPVPIWQAGIGEAVIGLALLAAAVAGRATVSWVAFWMSVVGIAFGLSSP